MKSAFKAITVISALGLMAGCPDKGSSNNANNNVTIAGINSNGQCTQQVINSYRLIQTQGVYGYNTRNECNNLLSLIADRSCQAQEYNQTYTISYSQVQNICQAALSSGNNGGVINPGNPIQQPVQGMKNFSCQLIVKNGAAAGDTGVMNVAVPTSGGTANVFAYVMQSKKFLGIFNMQTMKSSNKFGKMELIYKASNGVEGDRLTLSASGIGGVVNAAVTGFAGSQTTLEIGPKDEFSEGTYVNLSCVSAETSNPGNTFQGSKYECRGRKTLGQKITEIRNSSSLDLLVNEGLEIAPLVYAEADAGQSAVRFTSEEGDYRVQATTNMSTAVQMNVKNSLDRYSLSTNCRITN